MLKNLLDADETPADVSEARPSKRAKSEVIGLFGSEEVNDESSEEGPFILSRAEPESFAENARRSGLAWSMGIAFFSAVVFMLLIGWGADLLFGTSPWGIVAGIVLGSIIGFFQLFRLSSQIFRK